MYLARGDLAAGGDEEDEEVRGERVAAPLQRQVAGERGHAAHRRVRHLAEVAGH